MIDVVQLKERTNCRDLIERDLGRPKYRGYTYSSYACPLHNEQKGHSLVVYADHWYCFGKCNHGGDAIAWLREYHKLSFQEACERLGGGGLPLVATPYPRQPGRGTQIGLQAVPRVQLIAEPPDRAWQEAAYKVERIAMEILWSKAGARAWRYLEETRGLTERTIVTAGLGYIPGHYHEWKSIEGLSVPCGITIPWRSRGNIWGIKVRRASGEPRYQQVSGGNIKGSLYLGDYIKPGLPVLLAEGEFDALIAQQAGAGQISAAAIGSAANKHINPRWFAQLITAPRLLIRMDDDPAGQGAAEYLASLTRAARRVQVPQGKDINDFYLLAGHKAVSDWIRDHVG